MAKNILIGICGGIAAYKIPLLLRLLKKQGDCPRVVMTANAEKFVAPMTLQVLTGEKVRNDLFATEAELGMGHIELARWADIFLIAPATANTIAKLANGIADDLLTTLYLATAAKVMIAPAMNQQMYNHPAVQHNLALLASRSGHVIIPPDCGIQACGDNGPGRLPEPEQLLAYLNHASAQDLSGLQITITAGATQEAIDPVRYLTNHSSGKMGYALAAAALKRGAKVHLISAPTALTAPVGVSLLQVVSAVEMYHAALNLAAKSDIFIAAAAVADYRCAEIATHKLKKGIDAQPVLQLTENPDIVATVAKMQHNRPFTVGFAAETDNLQVYARDKLQRKHLDLIIANDVSADVFGADENEVIIIGEKQTEMLPRQQKTQLADLLLSRILAAKKAKDNRSQLV